MIQGFRRLRPISGALVLGLIAVTPLVAGPSDPVRPTRMSAFGAAVAISGSDAFVGEPRGAMPGAVHLYRRGTTGWKLTGDLTAPSGHNGDGFGAALAVGGNHLLVSRIDAMNGADSGRGAVLTFSKGADGKWSPAGELDGGVRPARAGFGQALAITGDLAIVGAPGAGTGGEVMLYRHAASGWTAAGTLAPAGLAAGDRFGTSLAVDGNVLAVGAPGRESKGAIYLFRRGSDGGWVADTTVTARRVPTLAQFGGSVALSGNRLMGAAPSANQFAGMVVVFERDAKRGIWTEKSTLTGFDVGVSRFGSSMAVTGDELWVGAPNTDRTGQIYRIRSDRSGGWTQMTKWSPDSLNPGASFGATMMLSGNSGIVGMPGDGGGLGTVAFLSRSASGNWTVTQTAYLPAKEFASVTGPEVRCEGGKAKDFDCGNTGLLSFLPISALGGQRGTHMNDNWGWTDPQSGREYALLGRTDGTAFVDVTDPAHPRYLGNLPKTTGSPSAAWRDIKTYKNHAFIVADASGDHGMQVFDLTRLRSVKTPQTFTPDMTYDGIHSAHNIVINEESGYAYAVGSSSGGETCGGGLHMIDIRDPKHPTFAGCFSDTKTGNAGTGYSHDAQCVTYHGPDTKFKGHEICIGSNETAISVADVTDKKNPVAVSHASYPNVAYAHQGWFSDDHKYFYLDDEGDESAGKGKAAEGTRTMVFDLSKLEDPVLVKEYVGVTKSIDHNLYVKGNRIYEANYTSGLRILDISDPMSPREVGYFDTYPADNSTSFSGAWSTYPYFKSGTIIITSIGEGVFFVRDRTNAVP
ncbi:MAG: choice-of-anchor B family protein [Gemmatimonadota bacterium]